MSFLLSVVRLIPAMIFSVLFAWLIARTDMPGGKLIEALLLDRLFRSGFSLGSRLDSFAGSQFRLSQHVGKELALRRRRAVQSLQLLGHRLGAHVHRWHMVQGDAAGAGVSPAWALPWKKRRGSPAPIRRQMLWRITLPVLSPMILAVAVLSFIRGLQSFNTELLLGTPAGIYVYSTKSMITCSASRAPTARRPRWARCFWWCWRCCCFFIGSFLRRQQEVHRGHRARLLDPARQAGQMALRRVRRLSALCRRDDASAAGVSGDRLVHAPLRLFSTSRQPFTLNHWHNMLADPIFLVALKNSLIIAGVTAIGGILLYSALAYLLVSRRTITAPLLESFVGFLMCCRGFF